MSLPTTHKALVLSSLSTPIDIEVQEAPTPTASSGSAIVKVLSTHVPPNMKKLFSGTAPYPVKLPFTPGTGSVGRVAELGADAISLQLGQLVFVHTYVHVRDDPSITMLHGAYAMGPAEKLMDQEWRHGSWAEYLKAPLENIFPLDEDRLINRMGYSIHDLPSLSIPLIATGGLADINLKPGQSIIVAPATGVMGGAAVVVALAIGARVIAAGRNEDRLKAMQATFGPIYGGRLTTVKLTGVIEADAEALLKASPRGKGCDAFIDFSPDAAAKSTHIKSCLVALKRYSQVVFMGGIHSDVSIPYFLLVIKGIHLKGKLMYDRQAVLQLFGMVEAGILKLGRAGGMGLMGVYRLEEVEAAVEAASENTGFGNWVVLAP